MKFLGFLILLFVCGDGFTGSLGTVHVSSGNLSTGVVRAFASAASLTQDELTWPERLEVHGKTNGGLAGRLNYAAVIQEISSHNFFSYSADSKWSLTFGSGGRAVLHFDLPQAGIRAKAQVRGRPHGGIDRSIQEGVAGFLSLDPFRSARALFEAPLNLAKSAAGQMDRLYGVAIDGISGQIEFRMQLQEEGLVISSPRLISLQFGKPVQLKLKKHADSLGVSSLEAIGLIDLDEKIKNAVAKYISGSSFVTEISEPIRALLKNRLALSKHVSCSIGCGLVLDSVLKDFVTASDLFASHWSVEVESASDGTQFAGNQAEDASEFLVGGPGPAVDELQMLVPLTVLERLVDVLSERGAFNIQENFWKVSLQALALQGARVCPIEEGQFEFLLPIDMKASFSQRGNGALIPAILKLKVRPQVKAGAGLVLELVSSELQSRNEANGFRVSKTLWSALSLAVASKVRKAFPQNALLPQKIAVAMSLQLEVRSGHATDSGLLATFDFSPGECAPAFELK